MTLGCSTPTVGPYLQQPLPACMTLYAVLIPMETATEVPTEDPTGAPTEAPTAAPSETETPAGGCGSVLALAILPCLMGGTILTLKKRKD